MRRLAIGFCAAMTLLAMLRPAAAEVLVLRGGGKVEGELVPSDEKSPKSYVVKLPGGGQITIDAAQVEKIETVSPKMAEFEKVRGTYPDTPEGQMRLAEWCRERGLLSQRKAILHHVIELDKNHAEARRTLGYVKVNDEWMTIEEQKAKDGYVRRNSRWMTQQEAQLYDERKKQESAEHKWFGDISRWRSWLDGNRAKQGKENLLAIKDPAAVLPLARRLKTDTSQSARLIYLEVLAKINTPEARGTLAVTAIDDSVEEVRLTALDYLEKQKDEVIVAYFIKRLQKKDNDNAIINRAATALGRMKNPTAVSPLIDFLVSLHKEVIQPAGGQGSMTTTFSKNGGPSGLGMNQKPTVIVHHLQNQAVLDALVGLTGQNFGYDQRAWRTWYATTQGKSGRGR